MIKRARLLSMKSYTVNSEHKVFANIWEVLMNYPSALIICRYKMEGHMCQDEEAS